MSVGIYASVRVRVRVRARVSNDNHYCERPVDTRPSYFTYAKCHEIYNVNAHHITMCSYGQQSVYG